MTQKIYIDAGHGGLDCGAVNGKRKEANDVLQMALTVAEHLKDQNCKVKLSRKLNVEKSITQRCKEANDWGADYFLSIHRNSAKDATGNEIWVYSKANDTTVDKAKYILNEVCKADGLKNRGVRKGAVSYTDYGVNVHTKMPSAIIELGFISNSNDNKAFDENFNEIALAIAKGTLKAIGVNWKSSYLVKVTTDSLNIRSGPGVQHEITGIIEDMGVYTIVETKDNWGKLKSGKGWISLKYTKKM